MSLGDHWAYRTAKRIMNLPDAGPLTPVRSLDALVRGAGLLGLICGVGILAVGSLHTGVDEL